MRPTSRTALLASKEVGARIRQARLALPDRPSQKELGDRIGVHKRAVGGWENGESGISRVSLDRLLDALGVEEAYLSGASPAPDAASRAASDLPSIAPLTFGEVPSQVSAQVERVERKLDLVLRRLGVEEAQVAALLRRADEAADDIDAIVDQEEAAAATISQAGSAPGGRRRG